MWEPDRVEWALVPTGDRVDEGTDRLAIALDECEPRGAIGELAALGVECEPFGRGSRQLGQVGIAGRVIAARGEWGCGQILRRAQQLRHPAMPEREVRGVLRGSPVRGRADHERGVVERMEMGEYLVAPERERGDDLVTGGRVGGHPQNISSA